MGRILPSDTPILDKSRQKTLPLVPLFLDQLYLVLLVDQINPGFCLGAGC